MSKTWAQCLKTLKDTVPLSVYSVWIHPLKVLEDQNTLSLLAPNTQVKNYISKNLKNQIKSAVAQHNKNLKIFMALLLKKTQIKRIIQNT
jgi:chromosomal replication initiator protein